MRNKVVFPECGDAGEKERNNSIKTRRRFYGFAM